jgi:hypothetical protein
MRIFGFGRCTVGLGALLIVVVGCGGSSSRIQGLANLPPAASTDSGSFKSYMLPQARDAKYLLYVSSFFFGIVHVFDFRTRKEVGLIAGFNEPTGQCVDANGDIWIAQADGHEVVEYPRASLAQIRSVQTNARPFGCSVAPNGDLAVADFDEGSAPGDVEVFKGGAGAPTVYTCNGFGYYPNSPGYDDKGNLFVEGIVSLQQNTAGVCVLAAGGNSLNPESTDFQLHLGGSAMWDGRYMTLADINQGRSFRDSTLIYRVSISSSGSLTKVGTTKIPHSNMRQAFILGAKNTPINERQGTVVVGPDGYHITRWKYPSGVKNSVPYVLVPNEVPFGESISIKI